MLVKCRVTSKELNCRSVPKATVDHGSIHGGENLISMSSKYHVSVLMRIFDPVILTSVGHSVVYSFLDVRLR